MNLEIHLEISQMQKFMFTLPQMTVDTVQIITTLIQDILTQTMVQKSGYCQEEQGVKYILNV